MELRFTRTHLSITSFPSVIIPDFTVITGANGAGKSHLLQAIQNGSITVSGAQANTPAQEIRMFDWNTLVPQDTGSFSSESLRSERDNTRNNFSSLSQHPEPLEFIRTIARQRSLPAEYIENPRKLIDIEETELDTLIGSFADAQNIRAEVRAAIDRASDWIMQRVDENTRASFLAMSAARKRPLIALDVSDVEGSDIPNWGRSDLFQQSFARLFVAYRDAWLSNSLAEFKSTKGYPTRFLSQAEFEERNGPPPWDFVNQTVRSAGLDFKINNPDQYDFTSYTPQLTKVSSGAIIPFSALSSGEKVLMSFAFCVYYANDRRQMAVYPKVILFDEIDAPLHPSMTRSLIETIMNTIVDSFGIKVLSTTHSPSTVALSPEESTYIMKPGTPGLHKVTKSEALNILTVGVPTLAISFDGRRQIFVESPADAATYDAIYKIIKAKLSSARSLEFVSTGGTRNVGCEVVKRLVASLVDAGNQSIFGLIDFDGTNVSSDRIVVLGSSERNGLENYIFDPLLIAALIYRDAPNRKEELGLDGSTLSYPGFLELERDELQKVVDVIGNAVFGGCSQKKLVNYLGGMTLHIDERWLSEDDHSVEAKILNAFPYLQALSKSQAGKLMQHMVSTVIADKPDFLPMAIFETFRRLLSLEAHI